MLMKKGVRNPMRLSKRGTTLVELIVALSLTAIFAVVCVALINPIERIYKQMERISRAELLADTIVDSIRKECDEAKNDDTNSVWIADGNINNDSGLFDEDCTLRKDEGHILVLKKNNSYCEAVFSELKITEQNKTDANNNSLEGTLSGHAVDELFQGDKENTEKGIVHFGYYQAGDKGNGVYPLKSYDYTNPVLASTYGDFYVKIYFKNLVTRDVTINSVTHTIPSFVECEVRIYEGDYIESDAEAAKNLVYTRTAALCFSANGSAPGSSYQKPDPVNTKKNIQVQVVWEDGNSTSKRQDVTVSLLINGSAVASKLVRSTDTKPFIFANVTIPEGADVTVAQDPLIVPDYKPAVVTQIADGVFTIFNELDDVQVKLIPGPDFNKLLIAKDKNTDLVSVRFGSREELEQYVPDFDSGYEKVSIDKNGKKTDDYRLFFVPETGDSSRMRAFVICKEGSTFIANEDCSMMFQNCRNLEIISDLNSVLTDNTIDMYRMFMDCRKLTSFQLNEWHTENVTNFDGMFRNVCTDVDDSVKLTIDISSFSFKNCRHYYHNINDRDARTGINKMFCNDTGNSSHINTIIFPTGTKEMQNIPRLQQVFSGCDNLEHLVNFNNLNLTGVADGIDATNKPYTGLSGVFEKCSKLTDVDFSNWDLSNENYNSINSKIFTGLTNVKSINLSGLKIPHCSSLGDIFNGCSSLTTINLNNSDFSSITSFDNLFTGRVYTNKLTSVSMAGCTVNEKDNWTAVKLFYGCGNLSDLNMRGFVNGKCTSFESIFENCKNITSINVGNWNTESVASMKNAFASCGANNRISNIDISSFKLNSNKVSNLDMTGMFKNTGFETITFPANNYESKLRINAINVDSLFQNSKHLNLGNDVNRLYFASATSANYLFSGCSSLVVDDINMSLPNALSTDNLFNGCTSITSVNMNLSCPNSSSSMYMFNGCTSLENATLKLNLPKVDSLYSMFNGCTKLAVADLSKSVFTDCTSINSLFNGCSLLETVTLDEVDLRNCGRFTDVFKSCSKLKTVNMNRIDLSSATKANISFVFSGGNLENLYMADADLSSITDYSSLFKDKSKLKIVDMSHNPDNNVSLNISSAASMFYGCTSLQTVYLNNVTLTGCSSTSAMFQNCYKLENIEMKGFKTPDCTDMTSMFEECNSVKTINLSEWDTGNVKKMDRMFYECAVNVSNRRTSAEYITVDVSSFNFNNLETCNYMFNTDVYTDYIKTIILPSDPANANAPKLQKTERMFRKRVHLESIENMGLLATTTKLTSTKSMFSECNMLETIDVSSMNFSKVSDTQWMFNAAKNQTQDRLTTIYVSSDPAYAFKTVSNSSEMFANRKVLVGQANTRCDGSNPINIEYARIDEGPNSAKPGYFSVK